MSAYAWECGGCGHLSSRHLMESGGTWETALFQCRGCDCRIRRDAVHIPLTERQLDARHPGWRSPDFSERTVGSTTEER